MEVLDIFNVQLTISIDMIILMLDREEQRRRWGSQPYALKNGDKLLLL